MKLLVLGGTRFLGRHVVDAARRENAPRPLWLDDATLLDAGVEPWMGLPLWIPDSDPSAAGSP